MTVLITWPTYSPVRGVMSEFLNIPFITATTDRNSQTTIARKNNSQSFLPDAPNACE